ncbi:MAG: hypothetical protein BWY19_00604 [bacterium ADurb.Bin212]|nr:MAG: hypothetical protein BWY19_00604 [bacterium ADurb.Bin212]
MSVNRIFWATLAICFGLLWLLSNLGILPSAIWYQAWRLWPIIIILWGVSILFLKSGFKSFWFLVLSIIIIGAAFSAFALIYRNQSIVQKSTEIHETISEGVKSGRLFFALGAVNFSLSGGDDCLLCGQSETISGVEISNSTDAKIQTVRLNQLPFNSFMIGPNYSNRIDLKTRSDLPVRVDIDSGASKIDLNLKAVMLESLDIDSGATSSIIVLGEKVNVVDVNISCGASNFQIQIPEGFAVKVVNKSGLSGNNFSAFGLDKEGETWLSRDYKLNDKVVNINFESGVSNLELKRY